MNESCSVGKIIRRLRIERNLTQDALAERLGITAQAVSRWESGAGMPDISQLIPLASLFEVSTDLLLGLGDGINAEVERILAEAHAKASAPANGETVLAAWESLQLGLKRHPANVLLLMQSIRFGICLAYPENDGLYLPERAKEIYRETLRQAKLVTESTTNIDDILQARMMMVLLAAAHGEYERAKSEAEKLPMRSDMTAFCMRAYIAHFMRDAKAEQTCLEYDLAFHLEAMLDDLTALGISHESVGEHDKAIRAYDAAFALIGLLFDGEPELPGLHSRERGDLHALRAKSHIALGEIDRALDELGEMCRYDLEVRPGFDGRLPRGLLSDCRDFGYFRSVDKKQAAKRLLVKLDEFDSLKGNARLDAMVERVCDAAE